MNTQATYCYTLTDFNDPDRVAVPLVLATAALSTGAEALLWTTLDGVKIAKQGAVDGMVSPSFSAISDLMEQFMDAGGKIGVCPACAKTHGVTDDNLVENAVWMGAMAFQEAIQNREVISF